MSSRRLADPLRLSAEGASPDSVTSDVPCRRSGARAERSTLAFAAVATAFADTNGFATEAKDHFAACWFRAAAS
jgi:hypothetical protein